MAQAKLPSADMVVALLRAGHKVKDVAPEFGVSIPTVYRHLNAGGYYAADWMADANASPLSLAEAQRRKAAAEAVVAEIEASTRAGRIVVPEDRSEVTDDELDDVIEKLTAERVNRSKAAIYRQLPDALGYGFNLSKVGNNTAFRLRDDNNAIDLEWDFWVLLASDILDADEKARAAVAADRAA